MGHPAGVQGGPRWAAQRIRAVGFSEIDSIGRERIHVGRFDQLVADRAERIDSLLVGGDNQYVGPFLVFLRLKFSSQRQCAKPSRTGPDQLTPRDLIRHYFNLLLFDLSESFFTDIFAGNISLPDQ
jgi:hypothetical protein